MNTKLDGMAARITCATTGIGRLAARAFEASDESGFINGIARIVDGDIAQI